MVRPLILGSWGYDTMTSPSGCFIYHNYEEH